MPDDVEAIVKLTSARQREFMFRMKPHRNSQRMNAAEWDEVEPFVENADERVIWFGGMRLTWVNNRARRSFCFSEIGLNARKALQESEHG